MAGKTRGTRVEEALVQRVLSFLASSCYAFSGPLEFYSLAVNLEAARHGLPMVDRLRFRPPKEPQTTRPWLPVAIEDLLERLVKAGVHATVAAALHQAVHNLLEACLNNPTAEAPALVRWRPGQSAETFQLHLAKNPGAAWSRFLAEVPDTGGPICCPANRIRAIPNTRFRTWADFGVADIGSKLTIPPAAWVVYHWQATLPPPELAEPLPVLNVRIDDPEWQANLERLEARCATPEARAAQRNLWKWVRQAKARERREARDFSPSQTREQLRRGAFLNYPELSWATKVWVTRTWQSQPTPILERVWAIAWKTVRTAMEARWTAAAAKRATN